MHVTFPPCVSATADTAPGVWDCPELRGTSLDGVQVQWLHFHPFSGTWGSL